MKILGIVFLALFALFVGGCGLLITIGTLLEGWSMYSSITLIISVPSAVIGALAGWWAWWIFSRS